MANRQASFPKRQKEIAQKARQQAKAEKRLAKRNAPTREASEGEDPDIAHIRPGPQPPREDEL